MQEASPASRFVDAINSQNADRLRRVLAPDFVFEEAAGPGERSIEALLHELRIMFEAFPDLIFRPIRETVEGGRTYLEFKGIGTHRGEFLRVPPTGTTALVSGVFNLEDAGERIGRLRMTVDFGGLRRQLLLAARMQKPARSS
jgi:predicted ester cyclase